MISCYNDRTEASPHWKTSKDKRWLPIGALLPFIIQDDSCRGERLSIITVLKCICLIPQKGFRDKQDTAMREYTEQFSLCDLRVAHFDLASELNRALLLANWGSLNSGSFSDEDYYRLRKGGMIHEKLQGVSCWLYSIYSTSVAIYPWHRFSQIIPRYLLLKKRSENNTFPDLFYVFPQTGKIPHWALLNQTHTPTKKHC